jgi:hypothetical protein
VTGDSVEMVHALWSSCLVSPFLSFSFRFCFFFVSVFPPLILWLVFVPYIPRKKPLEWHRQCYICNIVVDVFRPQCDSKDDK